MKVRESREMQVIEYKKGWFVKYEWMAVFTNQGGGTVGKKGQLCFGPRLKN